MDDDIGYLADLERALVTGGRRRLHAERRRRRVVTAVVSAAVIVAGAVGIAVVVGDDDEGGLAGAGVGTTVVVATVPRPPATPPDTTGSSVVGPPAAPSTVPASSVPTTTGSPASSVTGTAPPTPTGGATAPCDPERPGSGVRFPVRRCDRGWGVVWVRNALAADGEVIEDGSQAAEFSDDVEAAVRRYQARHGLEVDGLVGPLTWFTMYPELLAATGPLAQYDADGSGRIEPAEVRPMGDSNAICDVPPGEDCPAPGAPDGP